MASMGNVPYLTWNVVPFRSRHVYIAVFSSQKFKIGPILKPFLRVSYFIPKG